MLMKETEEKAKRFICFSSHFVSLYQLPTVTNKHIVTSYVSYCIYWVEQFQHNLFMLHTNSSLLIFLPSCPPFLFRIKDVKYKLLPFKHSGTYAYP